MLQITINANNFSLRLDPQFFANNISPWYEVRCLIFDELGAEVEPTVAGNWTHDMHMGPALFQTF